MLEGAALLVLVHVGPGRPRGAAPQFRGHEVDRVVVELGIDQPDIADRAVAHRLPHRLRRVAERVRGGAGQAQALLRGEGDELAGLLDAGGEGLLGIDVLSGQERSAVDLVVGVDAREVDDDVDLGIGEEFRVRCVAAQAVGPRHRLGAGGIDVGDAADDQPRMPRPVAAM